VNNKKTIANQSKKKLLAKADLIALAIYFLFTCFFFLERTSFLDNPFTLFKLINDDSLFVNANRYPAAIMQLLPMLAIKLGLPLKGIMFVHSLGYFLFHASLFGIIKYRLKDPEMAWLLLSTLFIPVAHTFFWNNNELFLGLSSLCLWVALMRKGSYLSICSVAVVIAWIHPLLIVLVLFILATSLVTKDVKAKVVLIGSALYGASYFIKNQFFPNYYDTGKSDQLIKSLEGYEFSVSALTDQLSHIDYWTISLSCSIALILLVAYRNWLVVILLSGFIVCYLTLIDLTASPVSYIFYDEGNFRILFFVSAYALLVCGLIRRLAWTRYLIAGMLIVGAIRICLHSSFYTERISWYQTVAKAHDRTILEYGDRTKKQLIQSWASPMESIILSTLNGQARTLIFTENSKALEKEILEYPQMVTGQGRFLIYNPDNEYFRLEKRSYSVNYLD